MVTLNVAIHVLQKSVKSKNGKKSISLSRGESLQKEEHIL